MVGKVLLMSDYRPSPEDARILAEAIIKECIEFDMGDYHEGYFCIHCNNNPHPESTDWKLTYQRTKTDIIHEPNCPVLVAKDVLTRLPEATND